MEIDDARRLVRLTLPIYDLDDDAHVHFVKYRENHVFRVDTPDGRSYAVRLHRPGYRTDEEILTELVYLDALGRAGVPVPEVVRDREGRLMSTVATKRLRRVVSIQHWIPDALPFGDIDDALSGRHDPPSEAFREIGALIGRLHAAADEIGLPEGFRRAAWDADGLAGERPLWGAAHALGGLSRSESATLERAARRVHERLGRIGTDEKTFGVIHADATPENILVTPMGVVLIDFDDFGTGWHVFDLVTTIFHHARNPRYPEFERALLDGYSRHRRIPEEARAMWDDLMLARGLTYLGWAAERPGDPASVFITQTVAPWVLDIADSSLTGAPMTWRRFPTPPLEAP